MRSVAIHNCKLLAQLAYFPLFLPTLILLPKLRANSRLLNTHALLDEEICGLEAIKKQSQCLLRFQRRARGEDREPVPAGNRDETGLDFTLLEKVLYRRSNAIPYRA